MLLSSRLSVMVCAPLRDLSRFFSALTRGNIVLFAIAQGSSERSISAVVPNDAATNAVRLCHQVMLFNTNKS